MAAETETLTAPALTPERLDELEAMTRGWRRGYTIRESIELCQHVPALIASARRTQQAEAERDAALRAQQIAERDHALMKERAEVWRKEADQHLTEQAEQVAKRRAVEAERDAALKRAEAAERPDMFWWGDDPEQPHQSVHDLIVAFDVQAGEVALVQRASRLPDQWFVWGPQPAEGEDFDAYPGLKAFDTEAEAKAYAATLSQPGATS